MAVPLIRAMGSQFQSFDRIDSKMEVEIDRILSTRKYEALKPAVPCPDPKKFRGLHYTTLHKNVITYCDLLQTLTNDKRLWEKHEIPECIFHAIRLRYMIVGNVLKAIFMIHEKNKKDFIKYFQKEYVKTFTFTKSGRKVKIVVVKPIDNAHQSLIDQFRPPLENLSITPSRRRSGRSAVPSATEQASDDLRNNVSQPRPQPTPQNLNISPSRPIDIIPPTTEGASRDLRRSTRRVPKPQDPNAIEVLPDGYKVVRGVIVPPKTAQAPTTSITTDIEVQNEKELFRRFINGSGYEVEELKALGITTIADFNRFLDSNVQPTRRALTHSQSSDENERGETIIVHAEVHPEPVPRRVISQMHPVQMSPVPMPVTEKNPFAISGARSAEPRKSSLSIQQVQMDIENANATMGADNTGGMMQFVQEMFPFLPVTPPVPRPTTEKPAGETGERPRPRVQEQDAEIINARPTIAELMLQSAQRRIMPTEVLAALEKPGPFIEMPQSDVPIDINQRRRPSSPISTPRPTIAELMLQSAQQRIPTQVLAALEKPGPFIEMPQSDVPIDINQRTRPSSPLIRIGDMVEDATPARRTPVRRKRYCFYSKLVVSRKLNKIIKRQTYVSNAERVQNSVELMRDPGARIIPFDEYDDDQPDGDNLRYVPRFKGFFGGMLPNCRNMMANLLCQLFEQAGEEDAMYDEENECEMRVENLRASMRYLRDSAPKQSGTSYGFEEESPRRISLPVDNPNQSILQIPISEIPLFPGEVIPPRTSLRSSIVPRQSLPSLDKDRPVSFLAPEIPQIPAQTPLNVSNIADVQQQMPTAGHPSLAPKSPVLPAATLVPEVEVHTRENINVSNIADVQQIPTTERPSLAPKSPVHPAAAQVLEVEVQTRENIERDRLIDWENVIPLQIPTAERPSLAPKSPVVPAAAQIPEVEVQTRENIERDRLIDWENVIPQQSIQKTVDQNIADVVQTTQVPILTDTLLQAPVAGQGETVPVIHIAEVEVRTSERIEREKAVDIEEIIPQKRSRRAIGQNIVDISQIPTESERAARDLQQDQNAMFSSQAFAEFQRQREQAVDPNIFGVTLAPIGTEQPMDQTVFDGDPYENIPPRRPRVTNEMVLEKLTTKWMENRGESVRFTALCPLKETNRFTAASSFSVLIDLQRMKMLKLDQLPVGSWSPASLIISPP